MALINRFAFVALTALFLAPGIEKIPDRAAGIRLTAKRTGPTITAKLDGRPAARSWQLQLVGVKTVAGVKGGTAVADPAGVVISPVRGARELRITLAAGAS